VAITTPDTIFTHDILGRFVCNTFTEATQSGPFDVIILGGGTFGLALAEDLFFRSGAMPQGNYRILVLEAGPFTLLEHTQDIPNLQLYPPGRRVNADPNTLLDMPPGGPPTPGNPLPATRPELLAAGLDQQHTPLLENWGLAWNSNVRFGGLAYCLGGRSLYFGGWSPRYLATEMETAPADPLKAQSAWPQTVVDDLGARFHPEAARQTGVSTANDYINGALHDFYRKRLFQIYNTIASASNPNTVPVPLTEFPDYPNEAPEDVSPGLKDRIASPPFPGFQDSLKLDAPLAVQILSRPGFFPFNKFSSPPLAITAARQAWKESNNNDANKRLMIVPDCHIKGLRTRTYTLASGATVQEVDGIDTGNGFIDLAGPIGGNPNRRPVVILAMGAIESARLALLSVGNVPNANLMGANLMVHLRKNVLFTASLPAGVAMTDLELTALLVRCRTTIGATTAHFHFQITASGQPAVMPAGQGAGRSDALLFQNVPDLDNVRHFEETAPGEVDVAIRAVGEMLPNAQNTVTLPQPPDLDEFNVPRASVSMAPRAAPGDDLDKKVMQEMDQITNFLAHNLFDNAVGGNGNPVDATGQLPDGLGTTYHESGTLRMGDDPTKSVVNPDGQFHFVTNLYAGDAAVLPTCGSANPVMNGIALQRRLAKRLVPEGDVGQPPRPFARYKMPPTPPAPGTVFTLFDGKSLANWRMAGRGTFHVIDGALQSVPSALDLGLLWCTLPMPQNYRLELEFLQRMPQTNSGVFIRFTNPEAASSGVRDVDGTLRFNPAWSAVVTGFEVQIDNTAAPDGRPRHKTGAVYAVNYPNDPPADPRFPAAQPGDFVNPQASQLFPVWNQYRIEIRGDVITVNLNGVDTAQYTNTDAARGRFSPTEPTFIGLQSYSNYSFTTGFRNIRVTVL
jgi:choline dehydrogenase-like flavoprotein